MHLKRNAPRNHAIHRTGVLGHVSGVDLEFFRQAVGNHDTDDPGIWTFVGPDNAACWMSDDGDVAWADAYGEPGTGLALARHVVEQIGGGSLSATPPVSG